MNDQLIGQPPINQQVTVNLNDCVNMYCLNCKKLGKNREKFNSVTMFKVIPRTLSPTGKESIVTITQFVCRKCGNILKDERGLPVTKIES